MKPLGPSPLGASSVNGTNPAKIKPSLEKRETISSILFGGYTLPSLTLSSLLLSPVPESALDKSVVSSFMLLGEILSLSPRPPPPLKASSKFSLRLWAKGSDAGGVGRYGRASSVGGKYLNRLHMNMNMNHHPPIPSPSPEVQL